MPKPYIKKTSGPKYKLGDVLNAVSDVSSGLKTYRQASLDHKVPLTVIFNRINGRKTNINHIGSGRQCELTPEVEDELERCLIARAEMGYPCSRKELKEIVQEYIQHNQLETRFNNGRPGDVWYYGFMKRHPRISLKMPEHLQKARRSARDPFVMYGFFDDVQEMYKNSFKDNIEPALIFNADETGFKSDP